MLAEYERPEIVILHSIRTASERIRSELKTLGDEKTYAFSLSVIKGQAGMLAKLAEDLERRFERRGAGE